MLGPARRDGVAEEAPRDAPPRRGPAGRAPFGAEIGEGAAQVVGVAAGWCQPFLGPAVAFLDGDHVHQPPVAQRVSHEMAARAHEDCASGGAGLGTGMVQRQATCPVKKARDFGLSAARPANEAVCGDRQAMQLLGAVGQRQARAHRLGAHRGDAGCPTAASPLPRAPHRPARNEIGTVDKVPGADPARPSSIVKTSAPRRKS